MAKKRLSDSEKKILREMLEEEELILDKIVKPKKQKKKKKDEELIKGLIGEAKKDYSDEDQKFVEGLLGKLPEKRPEKKVQKPIRTDFMKIEHQSDKRHKQDLQKAFDNYPRIHRKRVIKVTLITLLLAIAATIYIIDSGFFHLERVAGPRTVMVNKTVEYQEVVTEEVEQDISNSEYLSRKYNNKYIEVWGFLKHDTIDLNGADLHVYSVVDDEGEEIVLTQLDKLHKTFFNDYDTSPEIYEVGGIMSYIGTHGQLKVETIKKSERPTVSVEKTVTKTRVEQVEETVEGEDSLRAKFLSLFVHNT